MKYLEEINRLLGNFKEVTLNGKKPYNLTVNTTKDIKKIPILNKSSFYDFKFKNGGFVEKPVVIYTTSGSTEKPLIIGYSKKSWLNILNRIKASYKFAKVKREDTILNIFAYGTFVAGSIYDMAARSLGLTLLPFGPPNMTDRETLLKLIKEIPPNVLCGVPNYTLEITNLMFNNNLPLPKKILCAGEPLTEEFRIEFKKKGVLVFDNYGCTEIPAISAESQESGGWMELLEEGLFTEFINEKGEYISEGEGNLIITDLHNYSTPIIRYKIADKVLVKLKNGKRFIKVLGRKDNLTKFKGYLLNLESLIKLLRTYSYKFQVVIDRDEETLKDKMIIHLPKSLSEKSLEIQRRLKEDLKLKAELMFEENIPEYRTISGKLKYILDKR